MNELFILSGISFFIIGATNDILIDDIINAIIPTIKVGVYFSFCIDAKIIPINIIIEPKTWYKLAIFLFKK